MSKHNTQPKRLPATKVFSLKQEDAIIKTYVEERPALGDLVQQYKTSYYTINKILKHNQQSLRSEVVIGITDTDELEIVRKYTRKKSPASLSQLAVTFNTSSASLVFILRKHGVTVRHAGGATGKPREHELAITKMWFAHKSSKHISKVLRIPRYKAARLIAKYCPTDARVRKMVFHVLTKIQNIPYAEVHEIPRRVKLTGECKICTKHKKLSLDHCHSSGFVRGLLCSQCNAAIGLFKEDRKALINAISYIEEHQHLKDAPKTTKTRLKY